MLARVTVRCTRQRRVRQRGEQTFCRGWSGRSWQTGHRGNSSPASACWRARGAFSRRAVSLFTLKL
jgi:hypothetical protein